ncbi:MAG: hypothetical protein WAK57_17775 [Desulfobacterales bacterium]
MKPGARSAGPLVQAAFHAKKWQIKPEAVQGVEDQHIGDRAFGQKRRKEISRKSQASADQPQHPQELLIENQVPIIDKVLPAPGADMAR